MHQHQGPQRRKPLCRRFVLTLIAGSVFMASTAGWANADTYPNKPIKLIVPFAPGGPTDALARHLAGKMSETIGGSVIVENRSGAGGTMGAAVVARAPSDGYTLLFHEITATFAIQPVITKNLPYDVKKDFTPIALTAAGPIFMVVNTTVPARNAQEVFELAKQKSSNLSFGTAGISQFPTHIVAELLKLKLGLNIAHVPYKGTGPAIVDVAAGRVSMIMTTGLGSVQSFVDSGKMKPMAVTGTRRAAAAPDVPTFEESGVPLPELEAGTMWGVLGPAGIPKEIVTKLNKAVVQAMESPEVRQKVAALSIETRTSTPEELGELIRRETESWSGILKRMDIDLN